MKRYFAIGAAWTAAAAWLEQAFNFVIFLAIARLIGTESFGLASMALAFVLLGEFLVRDTLTEGIVERRDLEGAALEATFAALVGLGLAVSAVLVLTAPLVAGIYNAPLVTALIIAACPAILLIALSGVSTALLRRQMAFRSLALRTVAGVIAGGAVGIYLALEGHGAWSLVGQRLAAITLDSLLSILAAGWWPKRLPRRAEFDRIGGLGPRVVVLHASTLVKMQTPAVALGVAIGPHAVAVYALAWRLVEVLLKLVVVPLRSVAQSAIAVMRRRNIPTAGFFVEVNEVAALASFAALAGLALVAQPAIEVLFGPDWRETADILPWIGLAGAMIGLAEVQESYLMAIDRIRRIIGLVILETIFGIAIIAIASTHGALAASVALAVRAALFLVPKTLASLAPESIPVARYARSLWVPVLAGSGMAMAVALWRSLAAGRMHDAVFLAGAVAIGMVSFAIILVFLMPDAIVRLRSFVETDNRNVEG